MAFNLKLIKEGKYVNPYEERSSKGPSHAPMASQNGTNDSRKKETIEINGVIWHIKSKIL